MNLWNVPWLEIAIALPLIGAVCVSFVRDPLRAFRFSLVFTGSALAGALLTSLSFYCRAPGEMVWSLQTQMFGRRLLQVDALARPLLIMVALLHFLTAVATSRVKMHRFSFAWSLMSEAIRLATFGANEPWLLIGLLAAGILPAYVELRSLGKPTRVFVWHMALFVGLLVLGWAFVVPDGLHQDQTALATVPLLAAVLIRCGAVPAHCWIIDWFEHASFTDALLFVAPLTGVYAAVRLVLPIAPDWVLQSIGIVSLITAVYAAGMATMQRESRRFFAYLFISNASLVLVGLELHSSIGLTSALSLHLSVALSLAGLGLTLRALEARVGRLSLNRYHGLYEHSPALAVCFLLTGLASVGFPGTLGFVAGELLVDGAISANLSIGIGVVVAAALNGIAVLRAYFLLFTGARHVSTLPLRINPRERIAVLTLAALILIGGLFPQPGVASRFRTAKELLNNRKVQEQEQATSPVNNHVAEFEVSQR